MPGKKSNHPLSVIAQVLSIGMFLCSHGAWAAGKYKTLHAFKSGEDGSRPGAGVIFDQAGNLYGTAEGGGPNAAGDVFQLTPNPDGTWTENVLYNFCALASCTDGASPQGGLVFDTSGNLYGTTKLGGVDNYGEVFRLSPNGDGAWTENVLYSFMGSDGSSPTDSLTFDASGDLYGTTSGGGAYAQGTVFKLTPQPGGSWTESVLYDFPGGDDGSTPLGGVIFDAQGNLYGTTFYGGRTAEGIVFKLKPSKRGAWTLSVLHGFNSNRDGGQPVDSPIMDSSGNLYLTTPEGGRFGYGMVFELVRGAGGEYTGSVLHDFTGGRRGEVPQAGLIFDLAGDLYGTTYQGGNLNCVSPYGCGVVFKMTPQARGKWSYRVLHRFSGSPGALPVASVIFDATGDLYGTTQGGLGTSFGSVFEFMP